MRGALSVLPSLSCASPLTTTRVSGSTDNAPPVRSTAVLNRIRYHPNTRDYLARRTAEGLSKKEIIRCLKRYVVREVYTALLADYRALTTCGP